MLSVTHLSKDDLDLFDGLAIAPESALPAIQHSSAAYSQIGIDYESIDRLFLPSQQRFISQCLAHATYLLQHRQLRKAMGYLALVLYFPVWRHCGVADVYSQVVSTLQNITNEQYEHLFHYNQSEKSQAHPDDHRGHVHSTSLESSEPLASIFPAMITPSTLHAYHFDIGKAFGVSDPRTAAPAQPKSLAEKAPPSAFGATTTVKKRKSSVPATASLHPDSEQDRLDKQFASLSKSVLNTAIPKFSVDWGLGPTLATTLTFLYHGAEETDPELHTHHHIQLDGDEFHTINSTHDLEEYIIGSIVASRQGHEKSVELPPPTSPPNVSDTARPAIATPTTDQPQGEAASNGENEEVVVVATHPETTQGELSLNESTERAIAGGDHLPSEPPSPALPEPSAAPRVDRKDIHEWLTIPSITAHIWTIYIENCVDSLKTDDPEAYQTTIELCEGLFMQYLQLLSYTLVALGLRNLDKLLEVIGQSTSEGTSHVGVATTEHSLQTSLSPPSSMHDGNLGFQMSYGGSSSSSAPHDPLSHEIRNQCLLSAISATCFFQLFQQLHILNSSAAHQSAWYRSQLDAAGRTIDEVFTREYEVYLESNNVPLPPSLFTLMLKPFNTALQTITSAHSCNIFTSSTNGDGTNSSCIILHPRSERQSGGRLSLEKQLPDSLLPAPSLELLFYHVSLAMQLPTQTLINALLRPSLQHLKPIEAVIPRFPTQVSIQHQSNVLLTHLLVCIQGSAFFHFKTISDPNGDIVEDIWQGNSSADLPGFSFCSSVLDPLSVKELSNAHGSGDFQSLFERSFHRDADICDDNSASEISFHPFDFRMVLQLLDCTFIMGLLDQWSELIHIAKLWYGWVAGDANTATPTSSHTLVQRLHAQLTLQLRSRNLRSRLLYHIFFKENTIRSGLEFLFAQHSSKMDTPQPTNDVATQPEERRVLHLAGYETICKSISDTSWSIVFLNHVRNVLQASPHDVLDSITPYTPDQYVMVIGAPSQPSPAVYLEPFWIEECHFDAPHLDDIFYHLFSISTGMHSWLSHVKMSASSASVQIIDNPPELVQTLSNHGHASIHHEDLTNHMGDDDSGIVEIGTQQMVRGHSPPQQHEVIVLDTTPDTTQLEPITPLTDESSDTLGPIPCSTEDIRSYISILLQLSQISFYADSKWNEQLAQSEDTLLSGHEQPAPHQGKGGKADSGMPTGSKKSAQPPPPPTYVLEQYANTTSVNVSFINDFLSFTTNYTPFMARYKKTSIRTRRHGSGKKQASQAGGSLHSDGQADKLGGKKRRTRRTVALATQELTMTNVSTPSSKADKETMIAQRHHRLLAFVPHYGGNAALSAMASMLGLIIDSRHTENSSASDRQEANDEMGTSFQQPWTTTSPSYTRLLQFQSQISQSSMSLVQYAFKMATSSPAIHSALVPATLTEVSYYSSGHTADLHCITKTNDFIDADYFYIPKSKAAMSRKSTTVTNRSGKQTKRRSHGLQSKSVSLTHGMQMYLDLIHAVIVYSMDPRAVSQSHSISSLLDYYHQSSPNISQACFAQIAALASLCNEHVDASTTLLSPKQTPLQTLTVKGSLRVHATLLLIHLSSKACIVSPFKPGSDTSHPLHQTREFYHPSTFKWLGGYSLSVLLQYSAISPSSIQKILQGLAADLVQTYQQESISNLDHCQQIGMVYRLIVQFIQLILFILEHYTAFLLLRGASSDNTSASSSSTQDEAWHPHTVSEQYQEYHICLQSCLDLFLATAPSDLHKMLHPHTPPTPETLSQQDALYKEFHCSLLLAKLRSNFLQCHILWTHHKQQFSTYSTHSETLQNHLSIKYIESLQLMLDAIDITRTTYTSLAEAIDQCQTSHRHLELPYLSLDESLILVYSSEPRIEPLGMLSPSEGLQANPYSVFFFSSQVSPLFPARVSSSSSASYSFPSPASISPFSSFSSVSSLSDNATSLGDGVDVPITPYVLDLTTLSLLYQEITRIINLESSRRETSLQLALADAVSTNDNGSEVQPSSTSLLPSAGLVQTALAPCIIALQDHMKQSLDEQIQGAFFQLVESTGMEFLSWQRYIGLHEGLPGERVETMDAQLPPPQPSYGSEEDSSYLSRHTFVQLLATAASLVSPYVTTAHTDQKPLTNTQSTLTKKDHYPFILQYCPSAMAFAANISLVDIQCLSLTVPQTKPPSFNTVYQSYASNIDNILYTILPYILALQCGYKQSHTMHPPFSSKTSSPQSKSTSHPIHPDVTQINAIADLNESQKELLSKIFPSSVIVRLEHMQATNLVYSILYQLHGSSLFYLVNCLEFLVFVSNVYLTLFEPIANFDTFVNIHQCQDPMLASLLSMFAILSLNLQSHLNGNPAAMVTELSIGPGRWGPGQTPQQLDTAMGLDDDDYQHTMQTQSIYDALLRVKLYCLHLLTTIYLFTQPVLGVHLINQSPITRKLNRDLDTKRLLLCHPFASEDDVATISSPGSTSLTQESSDKFQKLALRYHTHPSYRLAHAYDLFTNSDEKSIQHLSNTMSPVDYELTWEPCFYRLSPSDIESRRNLSNTPEHTASHRQQQDVSTQANTGSSSNESAVAPAIVEGSGATTEALPVPPQQQALAKYQYTVTIPSISSISFKLLLDDLSNTVTSLFQSTRCFTSGIGNYGPNDSPLADTSLSSSMTSGVFHSMILMYNILTSLSIIAFSSQLIYMHHANFHLAYHTSPAWQQYYSDEAQKAIQMAATAPTTTFQGRSQRSRSSYQQSEVAPMAHPDLARPEAAIHGNSTTNEAVNPSLQPSSSASVVMLPPYHTGGAGHVLSTNQHILASVLCFLPCLITRVGSYYHAFTSIQTQLELKRGHASPLKRLRSILTPQLAEYILLTIALHPEYEENDVKAQEIQRVVELHESAIIYVPSDVRHRVAQRCSQHPPTRPYSSLDGLLTSLQLTQPNTPQHTQLENDPRLQPSQLMSYYTPHTANIFDHSISILSVDPPSATLPAATDHLPAPTPYYNPSTGSINVPSFPGITSEAGLTTTPIVRGTIQLDSQLDVDLVRSESMYSHLSTTDSMLINQIITIFCPHSRLRGNNHGDRNMHYYSHLQQLYRNYYYNPSIIQGMTLPYGTSTIWRFIMNNLDEFSDVIQSLYPSPGGYTPRTAVDPHPIVQPHRHILNFTPNVLQLVMLGLTALHHAELTPFLPVNLICARPETTEHPGSMVKHDSSAQAAIQHGAGSYATSLATHCAATVLTRRAMIYLASLFISYLKDVHQSNVSRLSTQTENTASSSQEDPQDIFDVLNTPYIQLFTKYHHFSPTRELSIDDCPVDRLQPASGSTAVIALDQTSQEEMGEGEVRVSDEFDPDFNPLTIGRDYIHQHYYRPPATSINGLNHDGIHINQQVSPMTDIHHLTFMDMIDYLRLHGLYVSPSTIMFLHACVDAVIHSWYGTSISSSDIGQLPITFTIGLLASCGCDTSQAYIERARSLFHHNVAFTSLLGCVDTADSNRGNSKHETSRQSSIFSICVYYTTLYDRLSSILHLPSYESHPQVLPFVYWVYDMIIRPHQPSLGNLNRRSSMYGCHPSSRLTMIDALFAEQTYSYQSFTTLAGGDDPLIVPSSGGNASGPTSPLNPVTPLQSQVTIDLTADSQSRSQSSSDIVLASPHDVSLAPYDESSAQDITEGHDGPSVPVSPVDPAQDTDADVETDSEDFLFSDEEEDEEEEEEDESHHASLSPMDSDQALSSQPDDSSQPPLLPSAKSSHSLLQLYPLNMYHLQQIPWRGFEFYEFSRNLQRNGVYTHTRGTSQFDRIATYLSSSSLEMDSIQTSKPATDPAQSTLPSTTPLHHFTYDWFMDTQYDGSIAVHISLVPWSDPRHQRDTCNGEINDNSETSSPHSGARKTIKLMPFVYSTSIGDLILEIPSTPHPAGPSRHQSRSGSASATAPVKYRLSSSVSTQLCQSLLTTSFRNSRIVLNQGRFTHTNGVSLLDGINSITKRWLQVSVSAHGTERIPASMIVVNHSLESVVHTIVASLLNHSMHLFSFIRNSASPVVTADSIKHHSTAIVEILTVLPSLCPTDGSEQTPLWPTIYFAAALVFHTYWLTSPSYASLATCVETARLTGLIAQQQAFAHPTHGVGNMLQTTYADTVLHHLHTVFSTQPQSSGAHHNTPTSSIVPLLTAGLQSYAASNPISELLPKQLALEKAGTSSCPPSQRGVGVEPCNGLTPQSAIQSLDLTVTNVCPIIAIIIYRMAIRTVFSGTYHHLRSQHSNDVLALAELPKGPSLPLAATIVQASIAMQESVKSMVLAKQPRYAQDIDTLINLEHPADPSSLGLNIHLQTLNCILAVSRAVLPPTQTPPSTIQVHAEHNHLLQDDSTKMCVIAVNSHDSALFRQSIDPQQVQQHQIGQSDRANSSAIFQPDHDLSSFIHMGLFLTSLYPNDFSYYIPLLRHRSQKWSIDLSTLLSSNQDVVSGFQTLFSHAENIITRYHKVIEHVAGFLQSCRVDRPSESSPTDAEDPYSQPPVSSKRWVQQWECLLATLLVDLCQFRYSILFYCQYTGTDCDMSEDISDETLASPPLSSSQPVFPNYNHDVSSQQLYTLYDRPLYQPNGLWTTRYLHQSNTRLAQPCVRQQYAQPMTRPRLNRGSQALPLEHREEYLELLQSTMMSSLVQSMSALSPHPIPPTASIHELEIISGDENALVNDLFNQLLLASTILYPVPVQYPSKPSAVPSPAPAEDKDTSEGKPPTPSTPESESPLRAFLPTLPTPPTHDVDWTYPRPTYQLFFCFWTLVSDSLSNWRLKVQSHQLPPQQISPVFLSWLVRHSMFLFRDPFGHLLPALPGMVSEWELDSDDPDHPPGGLFFNWLNPSHHMFGYNVKQHTSITDAFQDYLQTTHLVLDTIGFMSSRHQVMLCDLHVRHLYIEPIQAFVSSLSVKLADRDRRKYRAFSQVLNGFVLSKLYYLVSTIALEFASHLVYGFIRPSTNSSHGTPAGEQLLPSLVGKADTDSPPADHLVTHPDANQLRIVFKSMAQLIPTIVPQFQSFDGLLSILRTDLASSCRLVDANTLASICLGQTPQHSHYPGDQPSQLHPIDASILTTHTQLLSLLCGHPAGSVIFEPYHSGTAFSTALFGYAMCVLSEHHLVYTTRNGRSDSDNDMYVPVLKMFLHDNVLWYNLYAAAVFSAERHREWYTITSATCSTIDGGVSIYGGPLPSSLGAHPDTSSPKESTRASRASRRSIANGTADISPDPSTSMPIKLESSPVRSQAKKRRAPPMQQSLNDDGNGATDISETASSTPLSFYSIYDLLHYHQLIHLQPSHKLMYPLPPCAEYLKRKPKIDINSHIIVIDTNPLACLPIPRQTAAAIHRVRIVCGLEWSAWIHPRQSNRRFINKDQVPQDVLKLSSFMTSYHPTILTIVTPPLTSDLAEPSLPKPSVQPQKKGSGGGGATAIPPSYHPVGSAPPGAVIVTKTIERSDPADGEQPKALFLATSFHLFNLFTPDSKYILETARENNLYYNATIFDMPLPQVLFNSSLTSLLHHRQEPSQIGQTFAYVPFHNDLAIPPSHLLPTTPLPIMTYTDLYESTYPYTIETDYYRFIYDPVTTKVRDYVSYLVPQINSVLQQQWSDPLPQGFTEFHNMICPYRDYLLTIGSYIDQSSMARQAEKAALPPRQATSSTARLPRGLGPIKPVSLISPHAHNPSQLYVDLSAIPNVYTAFLNLSANEQLHCYETMMNILTLSISLFAQRISPDSVIPTALYSTALYVNPYSTVHGILALLSAPKYGRLGFDDPIVDHSSCTVLSRNVGTSSTQGTPTSAANDPGETQTPKSRQTRNRQGDDSDDNVRSMNNDDDDLPHNRDEDHDDDSDDNNHDESDEPSSNDLTEYSTSSAIDMLPVELVFDTIRKPKPVNKRPRATRIKKR